MKFLLFNLVVVAALIYIITGDGERTHMGPTVSEVVREASTEIRHAVSAIDQKVDQLTDGRASARDDDFGNSSLSTPETVPTDPATLADETPIRSIPVDAPSAPIKPDAFGASPGSEGQHEITEMEDRVPVDDPAIARRRAEVLRTMPSSNPALIDEPSFMSARERERELHRLIEDMELTFADKLNP